MQVNKCIYKVSTGNGAMKKTKEIIVIESDPGEWPGLLKRR